jgi:hypothetical protein
VRRKSKTKLDAAFEAADRMAYRQWAERNNLVAHIMVARPRTRRGRRESTVWVWTSGRLHYSGRWEPGRWEPT